MGRVSKETVVLRRWEIGKQELGLSTKAWIITVVKFKLSTPQLMNKILVFRSFVVRVD